MTQTDTITKKFEFDGRTIEQNVNVGDNTFLAESYSSQFRAKIEETGGQVYVLSVEGADGMTANITVTHTGEITITRNGEEI